MPTCMKRVDKGSIYINVPPRRETEDGNLVVCVEHEPANTDISRKYEKTVEVETGTMCSFLPLCSTIQNHLFLNMIGLYWPLTWFR